jgi:hypothetical protein
MPSRVPSAIRTPWCLTWWSIQERFTQWCFSNYIYELQYNHTNRRRYTCSIKCWSWTAWCEVFRWIAVGTSGCVRGRVLGTSGSCAALTRVTLVSFIGNMARNTENRVWMRDTDASGYTSPPPTNENRDARDMQTLKTLQSATQLVSTRRTAHVGNNTYIHKSPCPRVCKHIPCIYTHPYHAMWLVYWGWGFPKLNPPACFCM